MSVQTFSRDVGFTKYYRTNYLDFFFFFGMYFCSTRVFDLTSSADFEFVLAVVFIVNIVLKGSCLI